MTKFALKVAEPEEIPVLSVPELITITAKWGKDHWSLLAYFETRVVDHRGVLGLAQMRINSKKRGFSNGCPFNWEDSWGTRMNDGSIPDNKHDDYDVMEEMEKYGFVKNVGSGINPVIELTDLGRKTCNAIREHKGNKQNFATFTIGQILKIA